MQTGVADPNPYDGIEAGKLNLWTYDHYHASTYGYYLEALVVFGTLTGRDPRSLGDNECSGYELGLVARAGEGAAAGGVRRACGRGLAKPAASLGQVRGSTSLHGHRWGAVSPPGEQTRSQTSSPGASCCSGQRGQATLNWMVSSSICKPS